MISPARVAAFRVLREVHGMGRLLPDSLSAATHRVDDERDRALAAEIVTGTLRHRNALDHVLSRAARRAVDDIDVDVLDLLRAAVYQLVHLNRVPPSAIVNDSVELARSAGKPSAAGFVNAVLRRVATNPSVRELPPRPPISSETVSSDREAEGHRRQALAYLSVTLSHPRWLVERWLDRVGFAAAERWCRFNNEHAPLTLRANTLRIGRDDLSAALAAVDVQTRPTRYAPYGLEVLSGHPLRTSLAAEGAFIVQEEASQLVATVAGVRPGWRVLDACASPGGKTVAFAGVMQRRGTLVAADLRARRVRLLSRTLHHAGADRVHIVQANLEAGVPFAEGSFDCVVVDAPCSGLGTIRRDPDIRWRRLPEDLAGFASRQLRLLAHASRAVRRGGWLVYATCSSEPEENEDVIARFRLEQPTFAITDLRTASCGGVPAVVLDEHGFLRTLPFAHDLEAFFAAVLERD